MSMDLMRGWVRPAAEIGRRARRLEAWPRNLWARLGIQLGFALPYALLVIWQYAHGDFHATTMESPNISLFATAAKLNFGDPSLSWIPQLNPFIPTALAALVREPIVFGFFGAAVAGWFLQSVLEMLHQRRIPTWLALLTVGMIATNPTFVFHATQNLALFLGLTTFIVGLMNAVRFIQWGSTYHGIQAGALLPVPFLADHNGFVYLLIVLAIVPVLRWHRTGQRGAGGATLTVLFFPALVTILSLAAVDWVTAGYSPLHYLADIFSPRRIELAATFKGLPVPNEYAFILPLCFMALVALIVRRAEIILVSIVAVGVELITIYYGFRSDGRAGLIWLVLSGMFLSFMTVGKHRGRYQVLAAISVVVMSFLGWLIAFHSPTIIMPFITHFLATF